MSLAYAIVAAVAVQRLLEMLYAAHNTERLLKRGAVERGRRHYPLFVLLHGSWLIAIAVFMPKPPQIHALPLIAFVLLQAARLWVIATLGEFWTTRIISLPGAPLVRKGPYRIVKHPNYLIVVGEIALLPLVFGEVAVALVFSLLNALLLAWRIRIENATLAERARI